MNSFTVRVPFTHSHPINPETAIRIPVPNANHRLERALEEFDDAKILEKDIRGLSVTVPLHLAGIIHDTLKTNGQQPGEPDFSTSPLVSAATLTAMVEALREHLGASTLSGFALDSVSVIDVKSTLYSDLTATEPSARIDWEGDGEVTWVRDSTAA
ncbi:hypothetical protein ACIPY5_19820 [Microbacterium sp. NPDC089698]|uniref:hypothetical protein n=1 Tax=Microbacterium sp. NPDC089698 TaxID=3364200 RepID=UPI0038118CBB